jgi:hypothetical protein
MKYLFDTILQTKEHQMQQHQALIRDWNIDRDVRHIVLLAQDHGQIVVNLLLLECLAIRPGL